MTVEGYPSVVLQAGNNMLPYLQFILETPNQNADLGFLDINTKVGNKQFERVWYQTTMDTGTLLNFRRGSTAIQEKYNRGYGAQGY